jgi:hypothetical protein
MAACEAADRKPVTHPRDVTGDFDAFSVEQFCHRHGLSIQIFYKRRTEMPATFTVGTRRLISREAAARWRAEREAAAAGDSRKPT